MTARRRTPATTATSRRCTSTARSKRSPETSNTEGLIDVSRLIMEKQGVSHRVIRTVDHDIASGVYPDMREHGWATDEWPELYPAGARSGHRGGGRAHLAGRQLLADQEAHRAALRPLGPAQRARASGRSTARSGGCLITGNEDGIKHCAMNVLYSLQHIGFTIPPQADAGWIGPVGPGPELPATRAPAARRTTSRTATPPS